MGDFNSEPSDEQVETFCDSYDLHNLVKEKTCFKDPPKCYDLILTNCKHLISKIHWYSLQVFLTFTKWP